MKRMYFIPIKKLAEIVTWVTEDTIAELCRKGEIPSIKIGHTVLIPTIALRLKYKQLPVEFWEEVCEDLYRNLDGPSSSRMRIERRKKGLNPSSGERTNEKE